jgi:hypothetical protein
MIAMCCRAEDLRHGRGKEMAVFTKQEVYWINDYVSGHCKRDRSSLIRDWPS